MKNQSLNLSIFCFLALAMPSQAFANYLYRCTSPSGVSSYSMHQAHASKCSPIFYHKTPLASSALFLLHEQQASSFHPPPQSSRANTGSASRIHDGHSRLSMYKYSVGGVSAYSNVRPNGAASVIFTYVNASAARLTRTGIDLISDPLNFLAYGSEISSASRSYGVDESLVRAVIHAESSYNPAARSSKGASGLMQLMPATAHRFGVSSPFAPAENILGGTEYLSFLSKRYSGNIELVAAAFNAGEGAVDRYHGVPPYSETRAYVQRVKLLAGRYRAGQ
jgi:soluble lytic murein transglycosylase-like protein